MEEEAEKVLLTNEETAQETKKDDVEAENTDEKKDNVNESLIQVENGEKKEPVAKKGKFLGLFERKKTPTLESEEPPKPVTEGFSLKKLFSKNEQPKSAAEAPAAENANEEEKKNGELMCYFLRVLKN